MTPAFGLNIAGTCGTVFHRFFCNMDSEKYN